MIKADIVGPICESGDFLARNRKIEKVNRGEYLSVMSAGAYGMSMSSNYNSRPRVAEEMVRAGLMPSLQGVARTRILCSMNSFRDF